MNLFEKDEDETIDIPDFVEEKEEDSTSVDMSIFNMSDDELYDDVPKTSKKDYEPKYEGKKKSNSTLIICLVLIAILLVTSVVSIIYAIKENKAAIKSESELSQLKANVADYQKQLDTANAQIVELNKKIEELNNAGSTVDAEGKYKAGTKLKVTEAGSQQSVKQKASFDSENIMNSDGTTFCLYWGDEVVLTADAVKDANGNYWGKIKDGFMRIEYDNGKDDRIWAEVIE